MMTKAKLSKKSKKSTNKKRTVAISPIIPIIALIEVLVLIVVSSYAWYFLSASKVIDTGTISVAADSGLDIDFQYSNVDDYINIWNYVSPDFRFEPATSLDGRNIYFPTSGTFNNTDTREIVLRDGTVNDINSKYLSIDFELTNTSDYPQQVYLNNNSYFHVLQTDSDNSLYEESRALRLSFYANDGKSGNVGSSLLSASGSSDGSNLDAAVSANSYTIYFDNSATSNTWGNDIYAYVYHDESGTANDYPLEQWAGKKMTRVTGQIYSITFDNELINGSLKYNKVIFNNNNNLQTDSNGFELKPVDKSLASETSAKWIAWHKFNTSGNQGVYSENTLYFLKPDSWSGDKVYIHAWNTSNANPYTISPGDEMTYVGSGIYSYSYDSSNTGGILFNNGTLNGTNQTEDIAVSNNSGSANYANDKLFYCSGSTGSHGHYVASKYATNYSAMGYKTVYLYNSFGWSKPYAVAYKDGDSQAKAKIAMVTLSANVYYCTVPDILDRVYFTEKDSTDSLYRTEDQVISNQKVYRPIAETNASGYRKVNTFFYSNYISFNNEGESEGFPVISPGVSVGFQRPYSPVVIIDAYSGLATQVVPAYSSSIDNYILGSHNPLFTLEAHHMISLSMIMWLEGTDEACAGPSNPYPGKWIDLKLEFSTLYYTYTDPNDPQTATEHIVNPGDSAAYTYKFYDKTREIWTSNRQPTESGVTVAPVMQLYDNTTKRGYLMSPSAYTSYDGKSKVSCWSVSAPQSIVQLGHDIIFRRVNPYNEDEVWNYWHAGRVAGASNSPVYYDKIDQQKANASNYSPYDIAFSGGNTISFTAFADGSPLSSMSGVGSSANVPAVSCGGLWGEHSVRTVTLYDGIISQPLDDNRGVMTINYSYPYKNGSSTTRNVTIEYKASTGDNGFFYFIIPNVAFANQLLCKFKQYKNFDSGYAINSAEKNPDITWVNTYGDANCKCIGDYVEITQETAGLDPSVSNKRYICYWGSDMFYIQTNAATQSYLYTSSFSDSTRYLFQVEFTDASSNKRYAYLYHNATLNPSSGTGFACVVPNDRVYTSCKLKRCDFYGNTVYNTTSSITIHYDSSKNVTVSDSYTGESAAIKFLHMNNKGLICTHIGTQIVLQTNMNGNNEGSLNLYWWQGNNNNGWPGYAMYWSGESVTAGSGRTLYKAYFDDLNVSEYPNFKFAYKVNGTNAGGQSGNMWININDMYSQMIYEADNSYTAGYVGNNGSKETIRYTTFDIGAWPHLTFQQ